MHSSTGHAVLARDVSSAVHVRGIMASLKVKVHARHRRACCPLCDGRSKWTVSFDREGRLWFCHRCGKGGDVFSLVEAVQGCDFKEALRFVAASAGIQLEGVDAEELRHCLQEERRRRERELEEKQEQEDAARRLRLERREELHLYERVFKRGIEGLGALGLEQAGSADADQLWQLAANALELTRAAETAYLHAAGLTNHG